MAWSISLRTLLLRSETFLCPSIFLLLSKNGFPSRSNRIYVRRELFGNTGLTLTHRGSEKGRCVNKQSLISSHASWVISLAWFMSNLIRRRTPNHVNDCASIALLLNSDGFELCLPVLKLQYRLPMSSWPSEAHTQPHRSGAVRICM